MPDPVRNRIKGHRRVRAGDLVPHEWNFRLHPEQQRAALQALYREVGFARSLLASSLPWRKPRPCRRRRLFPPSLHPAAGGSVAVFLLRPDTGRGTKWGRNTSRPHPARGHAGGRNGDDILPTDLLFCLHRRIE
jgi:hypothetical protein